MDGGKRNGRAEPGIPGADGHLTAAEVRDNGLLRRSILLRGHLRALCKSWVEPEQNTRNRNRRRKKNESGWGERGTTDNIQIGPATAVGLATTTS